MSFLLHQLLREAADAGPERPALLGGGRRLSYGELDARSNQLARLLLEGGIRRGDRVGLLLEKSLDAVVGLYGAMQAGAGYVPLDPAAPAARTARIAADCGLRALVSQPAKAPAWEPVAAATPSLETLLALGEPAPELRAPAGVALRSAADVDAQPTAPPDVPVIDEDLAYILYTSGSTGQPKGVMLSHRNALEFVLWAVREFDVRADDRLSQMAPLHFDLSTFDLFGAARAGAVVTMVPRTALVFPLQVRKLLEEHEISVVYAVPSVLSQLAERAMLQPGDLPQLRTVLFAGEVFPTRFLSRLMRLLPHAVFANLYGPTETNVCTFYRVPEPPAEDGPPIPIGRPIDNVETFVVTDAGRPAARGETGELYVRGGTVMMGYWGDRERTERTRVTHPFRPELPDPAYRTGDLVVERDDGTYTLLGRRDSQIKSRGYRIELGEIESALYAHPGVVECAVVAVPDERITHRLKAFVVLRPDVTTQALVAFCAERIPKYMIPEEFVCRSSLPKTSTGKVDRQGLEALDESGKEEG